MHHCIIATPTPASRDLIPGPVSSAVVYRVVRPGAIVGPSRAVRHGQWGELAVVISKNGVNGMIWTTCSITEIIFEYLHMGKCTTQGLMWQNHALFLFRGLQRFLNQSLASLLGLLAKIKV